MGQIRLKELHLTKLKIENLNHSAKSKIVLKAWEDAEVTRSLSSLPGASGSRRQPSAQPLRLRKVQGQQTQGPAAATGRCSGQQGSKEVNSPHTRNVISF